MSKQLMMPEQISGISAELYEQVEAASYKAIQAAAESREDIAKMTLEELLESMDKYYKDI